MDWQPIETAPTDGTMILLSDGKHFAAGKWEHKWWAAFGCSAWDRNTSIDSHDGPVLEKPTHWAPMFPRP